MNTILVFIHVAAGCIAIISGFSAMVPKKGSKWHILLGQTFFYSMLVMAGLAAFLATFFASEEINAAIGVFTLYLVLTSRWAASNRSGEVTNKDKIATVFSVALFTMFVVLSIQAWKSGKAAIDGVYVEAYYVYAVLGALAMALDIKVLIKGGVFGKQRIAKHLWRMVLALFIASGSLFLGQPQVFPEFIQSSGLLFVPVLLVVLSLFFWIVRVYIGKRFSY